MSYDFSIDNLPFRLGQSVDGNPKLDLFKSKSALEDLNASNKNMKTM